MPWPQDDKPASPQANALLGYLARSFPLQSLTAAGAKVGLDNALPMAKSVAQPFTNLFGNGGQEFWQGPQNPQAAQDMRNVLMTMYSPAAAPGAAAENALPIAARAYRGARRPEQWPPVSYPANEIWPKSEPQRTFWASSDPGTADTYAYVGNVDTHVPSVMPADLSFKNPLVVDAQHNAFDEIPSAQPSLRGIDLSGQSGGITNADFLAEAARKAGHDGLVINNTFDHVNGRGGKAATTYAALRPGTVKSPLTGETLFAGGGNPLLAAIMGLIGPQPQGQR